MGSLFRKPPVLGFAAFSGSGKTRLLEALLPMLQERDLRVGIIKHSHHDFEIDRAGKDSFRLRKAGARQMLIASRFRTVVIEERHPPQEPRLEPLLLKLDRSKLDLILVEGFRHERFPKIELHRRVLGKPFLHPQDSSIIAFASDQPCAGTALPQLDLNQPRQILSFILDFIVTAQTGALE
jgi:molybdopterin-guanine dinucleotide biosynthesis protein MobB